MQVLSDEGWAGGLELKRSALGVRGIGLYQASVAGYLQGVLKRTWLPDGAAILEVAVWARSFALTSLLYM